jgi:hypothetical protein
LATLINRDDQQRKRNKIAIMKNGPAGDARKGEVTVLEQKS